MTLDVIYTYASLYDKTKGRCEIYSLRQSFWYIIYIMVQARKVLLMWTTNLDSKKYDVFGIVDRTYPPWC